ncbi:hypothetical protein CDEST_10045 [Colletotrichum destructivum]|uniref:Uncharacterized protein n=1 Tax=Colletotrichum destructivum TaxID=34406 RepID=A0AAX4IQ33_9PEZI|nr:hypothetical protein CDEST_10045 [Colletotrichum destructivum]
MGGEDLIICTEKGLGIQEGRLTPQKERRNKIMCFDLFCRLLPLLILIFWGLSCGPRTTGSVTQFLSLHGSSREQWRYTRHNVRSSCPSTQGPRQQGHHHHHHHPDQGWKREIEIWDQKRALAATCDADRDD